MIALYKWDADGIYSESVEVDEKSPVPARSTPAPPPGLTGEQVAQWTGSGWTVLESRPVPPEPVIAVPESVTMRQARLAMLGAGILDDVEALIQQMPGDEGRAARIDWEYALDVRRDWPLINALGSQLGLTEQQIDELFIGAAAVPQ